MVPSHNDEAYLQELEAERAAGAGAQEAGAGAGGAGARAGGVDAQTGAWGW